ncbi:type IX secretion system outer membrane channel protein PorV [Flavobacterium psychrophilum]|uniref:type IX secretion system outer membrane channel protein PorV n=1 Tax=Flavobacterium psychrophilum TaxID=96345 RepID=UPI000618754C|nr:type IX secretion system outer membrane channel protein PorV [Flavobacterium psychrophilum]EKT4500254.1 type IX secretion system outer membrane channel protein PorV [Flavobacterium psychrophilum]ELM3643746.1 type IX secretion system outer membrane channel protein PorV [Flavobacterium psychrophilum]MBF2023471.1 type IX secretion system outer membrane channel protein PorV [Flavobacterium psychrophilum]MBF2092622.1 type IX secretion system outer membrane channel protein PorV [Flavobacterium psy
MKKVVFILAGLFIGINANAQTERPITTGVPFLLIASDARAAGMGDNGVATSPDAFSQLYNPAKYAFSIKKQGFAVSYTPYLTALVNDISLGQLNYFNKINERSAIGTSLRYFSLGEIQLTDDQGNNKAIVKPNELALDLSYSLKLSEKFSMAVAGRYIRSSLKVSSETVDASAASTFAIDVAGYYQSDEIAYSDFNGRWRGGFNLQNIGPKLNYDGATGAENNANFLPSNLRIGGGFDFILDDYNKISTNVEFSKLLVPTPQIVVPVDLNGDGDTSDQGENGIAQANTNYKAIGWTSGIFKSFGDAPGGFSEEIKEFTYAIGAEYWYQDSFAFRLGYFHESEEKGKRKYFTLGAGFKYNVVTLDVSYLFSASKVPNPLENTLRFSLTFNFGDDYDQN